MESLISIIVPIYQAEKYIERCVNSLVAQTYEKIEIILVDDGSTDASGALCDRFALDDGRIKVIHKANGGVSSARNAGLEATKGEYICFVDSDDTIPIHSISNLYTAISSGEFQYVAGVCEIKNTGKLKNQIDTIKTIELGKEPLELLSYITKPGSYSPYAKIYKASVIKENNIRYNEELKCSEDALFIRQYLSKCSKIKLIPNIVYEYDADNDGSLSKKGYVDFCFYYAEKMKTLENLLINIGVTEKQKKEFLFYRAVHGVCISLKHYFINWRDKQARKSFIRLTLQVLDQWLREKYEIQDPQLSKWYRRYGVSIEKQNINALYRKLNIDCINEKIKEKVIIGIKTILHTMGVR